MSHYYDDKASHVFHRTRRMSFMKRLFTTCTLVAVCMAALLVGPPSSQAAPAWMGTTPNDPITILGGCGSVFDVEVNGGEAHWTVTCFAYGATISGWVIDTKADGKCAYVKAFNDTTGAQMLPHAKACPKGTKTQFNWTTSGTSSISAYLYVL